MGSETPEADIKDVELLEEAKTRTLPSLVPRSSSSRPSFEPHEKDGIIPSHDPIPKSKSDGDLSRTKGAISPPSLPPHTPQWSMVSASPTIGITTSPPIQTMGTPSSFDPDRIPASVFSKPENSSDWSAASNDSLFSIHNSFNKDPITTDESNTPSLCVTEAEASEVCTLPPLIEVPPNEEGDAKSSNASIVEKEDSASPRISDESGLSETSFAFPVLESNSGKASLPEAAVEEKPEVRTQEANAAQDSTTKGWLSCFPCCARCC